MGNALAYGAADEPIRVRAKTEGGVFELSVANAGDPIPPAAVERLFQPFSRGAVRPNQQGLGLGLYIAAEIARHEPPGSDFDDLGAATASEDLIVVMSHILPNAAILTT